MDYKIIISVYAALISTIVFIWRIYEFYHDRKGKFIIRMNNIYRAPILNGGMTKGTSFLVIKITNISNNKRYIEEPNFMSDSKNHKYFNLLKFDKTENYPIVLESGQIHEYSINLKDLIEELKPHNISKIKTMLTDTHNKRYYSNWFELRL
jgi:hypothetical protein